MQGVYCPGDVHWARLEASPLGSLIAACPAWKRREEKSYSMRSTRSSFTSNRVFVAALITTHISASPSLTARSVYGPCT